LERTLANASANMGVAAADRYPRLSISGSLSALSLAKSSGTTTSQPWSFGPSLSLPLLDGGAGDANERSAAAQYAQAQAAYESGVRRAVEEVERALINLDSVAKRDTNAEIAAQGFASVLQSTEARWRAGATNAPTLELARRDAINAHIVSLTLKRDQVLHWIALYKALGGGWSVEMPTVHANK
jgi:outer membrane protein TolC